MNQQITELMIEAGKTIPGDKHIDADFCEKFAELIVHDCLRFVEVGRNKTDIQHLITACFLMNEDDNERTN